MKKKRYLLIAVASIFALTVTTAVGAQTSRRPVARTIPTQRIIQQMVRNTAQVDSAMLWGTVQVNSTATTSRPLDSGTMSPLTVPAPANTNQVTAQFVGLFDVEDRETPKFFLSVFDIMIPELSDERGVFTFTSIGETGYIYFDMPAMADAEAFNDFSALEQQWLRISPSTFSDMSLMETDMPNGAASSETMMPNLTNAQKMQLLNALRTSNIFTFTRLADARVNDVDTYRVGFRINREGLVSFMNRAHRIIHGRALTANELRELRSNLTEIQLLTGEISVGKTDFLPRKLIVRHALPMGTDTVRTEVTMFIDNYNNLPVEITAPPQSRDIGEVLREIEETGSGGRQFEVPAPPAAMGERRGSALFDY